MLPKKLSFLVHPPLMYFPLNFLLNPTRPIRPELKRRMVLGSGTTGVGDPKLTTTVFEI
jgi:hypothetical protein